HRDLKPENIMISKTGFRRNAVVLDFGLGGFVQDVTLSESARLTASHEMLGTPTYAAPEQLRGEDPTPRVDLYSWGLIFLECVTGSIPVHGSTAHEVIVEQLDKKPVPMPAWLRNHPLQRVLSAATAKEVEQRAPDADHLLELLMAIPIAEIPVPGGETRSAVPAVRERRQVTIVCCRITVSSIHGADLDIEELDHLQQAERVRLSEAAAQSGGDVINAFGDRVLIAFGYPQAREDDVRRAARLALDGVANRSRKPSEVASIEYRFGIHTGMVIVRDARLSSGSQLHDLTGPTPQIASQLADQAAAGEVLVSRDTQNLLRQGFAMDPAGQCVLPGLSEALAIYRLGYAVAGEAAGEVGWTTESPLVGRDLPLRQLQEAWSEANERQCRVIVVTGEAGIGKSRLLRELRTRLQGEAWIECHCAPENQSAALRPAIETLLSAQEPLDQLLQRYQLDPQEDMPLLAALIKGSIDERHPLPRMSPERQKELTFQALGRLLFQMAGDRPTIFSVENLHWADPTTIEFLGFLIQEVCATRYAASEPGPRLLLLLTTRSEFAIPWSSDDVTLMQLPRLSVADVQRMVQASLTDEIQVSDSTIAQVIQRAEGVPLFVEEISRLLLESRQGGPATISLPGQAVEIPASLRDLLTARLDGVSPEARETAQLAAVIGREVSYELLRAVSERPEASLRRDLSELGRAGLIYQSRGGGRGESCIFRHALIRDAAYEAIPRGIRQSSHCRIAKALHDQFPEIEQRRPELVAQHCEHGGEIERSIDYWYAAGARSAGHAAYSEARSQIEHAAELLRTLAPSLERKRREVELLVTLGTVLITTRGWSSPEVETTFGRAWELCGELGHDLPMMVLYGIWGVHVTRGDRQRVAELLPRMQELAESTDDPLKVHLGHSSIGAAKFWAGEMRAAHEHLARGRQSYGRRQHFAYDGRLHSYAFDFWALWALGDWDGALALRDEAMPIAQRTGDPYSISIVLGWGSMLAHDLGDRAMATQWGEELMTLAERQRLYFWWAPGALACGLSLVQQGQQDEGMKLIQEGLQRYKRVGVLVSYKYYLTYLAMAQLCGGDSAATLKTIDKSLQLCRSSLTRFHEPELLRLHAECLRRQQDLDGAEADFRSAIAMAECDGTRSYALRSATGLARLLKTTGRETQAAAVLQPYRALLCQSTATADQRAAVALLDELASGGFDVNVDVGEQDAADLHQRVVGRRA
ncbi:MAG: TOMM system kinase/cyclase fusion protein, partial [Deltaproteobacteria bacterium]|nr:TOMM system kinase/cyclase fusion protein [Deltaproteobacteria bacterium]